MAAQNCCQIWLKFGNFNFKILKSSKSHWYFDIYPVKKSFTVVTSKTKINTRIVAVSEDKSADFSKPKLVSHLKIGFTSIQWLNP